MSSSSEWWIPYSLNWKYGANPSFLHFRYRSHHTKGPGHFFVCCQPWFEWGLPWFEWIAGNAEKLKVVLHVTEKSSSKSAKTRCCLPQIKIPDWMRGYTCGMCGLGDGEYTEEYHTPNGRVATSAHSFTQSWVIPGTGCRDISSNAFFLLLQVFLLHWVLINVITICFSQVSVNINKASSLSSPFIRVLPGDWICEVGQADLSQRPGLQMLLCGACAALPAWLRSSEDHLCQRWLPLCACWWVKQKDITWPSPNASFLSPFLNRTISTAAESSVNRAEGLSRIFQKSVDVTEKAVAHLACRCNPQCA